MSTATTTAGINRAVKEGRISHTPGGNTKKDIMYNKEGSAVSKAKHKVGKRIYAEMGNDGIKGWNKACKKASEDLGYWPVPIKKRTEFYKLAKQYYDDM
jgi:hypothetical protein|eukprot:4409930-Prymnesium_polylepis.1